MFDLPSKHSQIDLFSGSGEPSAASLLNRKSASGAGKKVCEADRVQKNVKYVGQTTNETNRKPKKIRDINQKHEAQIRRTNQLRHQRHAARLLNFEHRVGLCKWCVTDEAKGVTVQAQTEVGAEGEIDRKAFFSGLQSCNNVWVCPCCGDRISRGRRDEMNKLLAWSRKQGHTIKLMTLTVRHGRKDKLTEQLEGIKKAKQRLHQHRSFKALKPLLVGSVTATEVTHGRNGWHTHMHVIMIFSAEVGDDVGEMLQRVWLASLTGVGMSGTGHGFDFRDASAASNYITKWGVAEEVALGKEKKGRSGRTPWQLLEDSCDRDDRPAGALWREFVAAFKGRRQLVWSNGLKKLAAVAEKSDEELAAEAEAAPVEDVLNIATATWDAPGDKRGAKFRRGRILDAVESMTSSDRTKVWIEVYGQGTDDDGLAVIHDDDS